MKFLDKIDRSYSAMDEVASRGWIIKDLQWDLLDKFHESYKSLENHLKLQELEGAWIPFIRYCRNLRYFAVATPLPPNAIAIKMREWLDIDAINLNQLRASLDSTGAAMYDDFSLHFTEFRNQLVNPLGAAAINDLSGIEGEDRSLAVLSPDARFTNIIIAHMKRALGGNYNVYCLRPRDLKAFRIYDEFITFGPVGRRYSDGSDFVYTSPRGRSLRLYTPAAFPTSVPSPYPLEGSPHHNSQYGDVEGLLSFSRPSFIREEKQVIQAEEQPDDVEQDWLESLPKIIVPTGAFTDVADGGDWETEHVIAKQVLLSADHAVFMDVDSSIYRINSKQIGSEGRLCKAVEYVDVRDVGPGDILLFQGAGGGSLVAELADQMLGDDLEAYKSAQDLWKNKLRRMAHDHDVRQIRRLLVQKGSKIQTDATVRNWCKSWNIGPGSWLDFDRLLQILGLIPAKDQIFQATLAIRTAHRQAGFKLARRLLETIEGQSLIELINTGRQEFSGAGNSNKKVAYEVVAVLPENCEVLENHLNRPFSLH